MDNKIDILGELLSCSSNLNLWKYDPGGTLVQPTDEQGELFDALFSISECKEFAFQHIKENEEPILLNDVYGLVWLAVPYVVEEQLTEVFVLGPVFTAEITRAHLDNMINLYTVVIPLKKQWLEILLKIPVFTFSSFMGYGTMVYYCLYNKKIERSEIAVQAVQRYITPDDEIQEQNDAHGMWMTEQIMTKMMEEGTLNSDTASMIYQRSENAKVGKLAEDPARQAKNEIIITIALYMRAAIRGGLNIETAYTLSDYYTLEIEKCKKVTDVYIVAATMINDYAKRTKKSKKHATYSICVRDCINYIDLHLKEKIELEEIAKKLGYTRYYLSAKFKKETGKNLNDYIKERKVDEAKLLLKSSSIDIVEISERLKFGSPSFFSATFKKYTGMTPSQYREG